MFGGRGDILGIAGKKMRVSPRHWEQWVEPTAEPRTGPCLEASFRDAATQLKKRRAADSQNMVLEGPFVLAPAPVDLLGHPPTNVGYPPTAKRLQPVESWST